MTFQPLIKLQTTSSEQVSELPYRIAHKILIEHFMPLLVCNSRFCVQYRLIDSVILEGTYILNACVEELLPAFCQKETPAFVLAIINGNPGG